MDTVEFSLVVPCYNEEDVLPLFQAEVVPALDAALGADWEIIFVDDGSRDRSRQLILGLHLQDPRIKGVLLSRNFGHQAAVDTGLCHAKGRFIGVMDCDLQDPVQVLLAMYAKCKSGVDVCYGVRARRDSPWLLKFFYSFFYLIMHKVATHDWPRDAGDFCVVSRKALDAVLALPENSRMFRGLRSWVGFTQLGFPYDRPTRRSGKSKYNLRKLVDLALLGFVGFTDFPLRFIGVFGFGVGLFACLLMCFVVLNRFFPQFSLFGYWVGVSPVATTILVIFLFFMSILFVFLGVIGEYIRVLLQEVKGRPFAVVDRTVGDVAQPDAPARNWRRG